MRSTNMIPLGGGDSRRKRRSVEHCRNGCLSPCQCRQPPPPPQYIEYINGQPESYVPRRYAGPVVIQSQKPRYVFDRLGHRYREHGGTLQLIKNDPFVRSAAAPYAYHKLENILQNNQQFIDATNRAGPNYLVQPPIELALETLKFIDDITDNVDDVQDYRTAANGQIQKRNIVATNVPYAEEVQVLDISDGGGGGGVVEKKGAHSEVGRLLIELSRASEQLKKYV